MRYPRQLITPNGGRLLAVLLGIAGGSAATADLAPDAP
jgi:hypothetical protein